LCKNELVVWVDGDEQYTLPAPSGKGDNLHATLWPTATLFRPNLLFPVTEFLLLPHLSMLAYESPSHFHSLDVVNNDPDGNMELDSDAEGSQADLDVDVDAEGVPEYLHNDQSYPHSPANNESMVASSSKLIVCIAIQSWLSYT
jgi:hypothetical protein